MLCRTRQVHFIIEQPLNSLFFHVDWLQNALSMCGASRHVTYAGGFGAKSLKPFEIHTSVPVSALRLLIADGKSARARVMKGGKAGTTKLAVKTRRTIQGKGGERHWTTGNKHVLKDLKSQPANQAARQAGRQPTSLLEAYFPACLLTCFPDCPPASQLACLSASLTARQPI